MTESGLSSGREVSGTMVGSPKSTVVFKPKSRSKSGNAETTALANNATAKVTAKKVKIMVNIIHIYNDYEDQNTHK